MAELTALETSNANSQRLRRYVYLLVIAVAAGSALANILTTTVLYSPARPWPKHPVHSPMFGANDRSRWVTVWSLVERGTYQIDEIIQEPGWNTIDKGRFRDHFYSSKPPFLSTIVAGIYWVLKHACGLDLLTKTHETVHVILLLINWLPWIVSLGLMAAIGERYARTDLSRVFLIIAAAGGTFLTTFLTTLNNHTIAAFSVVFALYPTLRILNDGRRNGVLFALAGFWGAFAACCEIPAALLGLALFTVLVRCAPAQVFRWFLPAAVVPLGFFFYTNWLCTGGLMPFYANFGAANDTFYKYVYKGVPSYWMNPSPQDVGESSALVYLFHCTFGHHGIFSLSPIFLLTIAVWAKLVWQFLLAVVEFARSRFSTRSVNPGQLSDSGDRQDSVAHSSRLMSPQPLRLIGVMSLVLTIAVLAFYLGRTQSYNYGGNTSGLRWAFWLIPLWLLAFVPALDEWGDRRWFRIASAVLLMASVSSTTFPHTNPWQQPWIRNVIERAK